jgi:hypothetical protein
MPIKYVWVARAGAGASSRMVLIASMEPNEGQSVTNGSQPRPVYLQFTHDMGSSRTRLKAAAIIQESGPIPPNYWP